MKRVTTAPYSWQWDMKDIAYRQRELNKKAQGLFSYLKAEFCGRLKPSSWQYKHRVSLCLSCPKLQKDSTDIVGYCRGCGCGKNPRSRLSVKLTMSAAQCPDKKWKSTLGFTPIKGVLGIWKNRAKVWVMIFIWLSTKSHLVMPKQFQKLLKRSPKNHVTAAREEKK